MTVSELTRTAGQKAPLHRQSDPEQGMSTSWDHSSYEEFLKYYSEKSVRPELIQHFRAVRDAILRILSKRDGSKRTYEVLDIGCNAGGQCSVWAESGHRPHGVDVNGPLLEIAKMRAAASGQEIDYRLGTATELPFADRSMDVCIATELLEHVSAWEACLNEFARILRPGGALLVTTTNKLCPRQNEFNLPAYSWYPSRLKKHFEELATTTRPELANHAKYPAVNWFTPYGLANELIGRGLSPVDRFELTNIDKKSGIARLILKSIRTVPALRFAAHCCYAGTTILGIKLP